MELLVALIVAVGAAVWVYGKIARKTGNNTKSSLIVSAITGVGLFIVVYLIARAVLPSA